MAVGDQFAQHFRFAHGEFEKAGNPVGAPPAGAGHAVEGVGGLAHPVGEAGRSLLVPGIAMPAAHPDSSGAKCLDAVQRAREFGSEGHLSDPVPVLQPFRVFLRIRVAEQLEEMRPWFFF